MMHSEVILCSEVAYRKHTSPHDQKARPQLYRLNQITTVELKINLALILTSETDMMQETLSNMTTEEDMKCMFNLNGPNTAISETAPSEQSATDIPNKEPEVNINEPCIVI